MFLFCTFAGIVEHCIYNSIFAGIITYLEMDMIVIGKIIYLHVFDKK